MELEASVRSVVKSFWFWSRRNVEGRMRRSWIPRIGQFKKTKKKSECRTDSRRPWATDSVWAL